MQLKRHSFNKLCRNWIQFKNHFRQAYKEISQTRSATVGSQLNQAKLVQQVIEGVQNAMLPPANAADEATDEFLAQVANTSTQSQDVLPKLLEQMMQMQLIMKKMQDKLDAQPNNQNPPPNGRNGQPPPQNKPARNLYCWTADHKDEATFANKMGGSMRYCCPVAAA
jgi:hypothetical protein